MRYELNVVKEQGGRDILRKKFEVKGKGCMLSEKSEQMVANERYGETSRTKSYTHTQTAHFAACCSKSLWQKAPEQIRV